MSKERKAKFELPKNMLLPDEPCQQDLVGFLEDAFLVWDNLKPEERKEVVKYFKEKTKHLQTAPRFLR